MQVKQKQTNSVVPRSGALKFSPLKGPWTGRRHLKSMQWRPLGPEQFCPPEACTIPVFILLLVDTVVGIIIWKVSAKSVQQFVPRYFCQVILVGFWVQRGQEKTWFSKDHAPLISKEFKRYIIMKCFEELLMDPDSSPGHYALLKFHHVQPRCFAFIESRIRLDRRSPHPPQRKRVFLGGSGLPAVSLMHVHIPTTSCLQLSRYLKVTIFGTCWSLDRNLCANKEAAEAWTCRCLCTSSAWCS